MAGVTFQDGVIQSPRGFFDVPSVSGAITLVMPVGMGAPASSLFEMPTCIPLPIQISGRNVIIPKDTLVALIAGTGRAQGVIVDAANNGYTLTVSRLESGGVRLTVN